MGRFSGTDGEFIHGVPPPPSPLPPTHAAISHWREGEGFLEDKSAVDAVFSDRGRSFLSLSVKKREIEAGSKCNKTPSVGRGWQRLLR